MFGKDREEKEYQFWRTSVDKDGNQSWEKFPIYDIEAKIKKLDPEGLGFGYANSDHPATNGEEITSEESEHFITDVNDHIAQLKDWYIKGIGGIEKSVEEAGINRDIEREVNEVPHDFEQKVANELTHFGIDQRKQIDAREKAKIALRTFRGNHELKREADYPESTLMIFALLFAALVAEGVLNSYFFMNASDLGLLGGFLNAMFASTVNVGWSFVLGWGFLRMLNQRERRNKIKQYFVRFMGGVLVVFSIGLLAVLHLTIAHFREQAMRNPEFELFEAFSVMLKNPMNINDMESFFLIVIGSIISIVAVVKGYNTSDHHFGYAKADRKLKAANEDLDDAQHELYNSIQIFHGQAKVELSHKLKNIETMIDSLKSMAPDIKAFFDCIEAYHEQAREGAFALVSSFRNGYNEITQKNDFPFDKNSVEKHLMKIEIGSDKQEALGFVENRINQLQGLMKSLEERQEVIHEQLRTIRGKYGSDENIDELLKKAKEYVENNSRAVSGNSDDLTDDLALKEQRG